MTHPRADTPLQPGDIVGGRYRVIQAVGDGPLDRLYEAQDVDLHERVIIRVQRRSGATDETSIRLFEDQARSLRVDGSDRSIRLLELSRDEEWGHFAAIANRENRPLPELLALLEGVNGSEEPPGPRGPSAPRQPRVAEEPPTQPPLPDDSFRFPSRQSQVELETLPPTDSPVARDQTQPRFAQPRRPKRLETLELDAPHISRSTGPRPAIRMGRRVDWRRLLRRAGMAALLLGALGAAAALYLDRQGRGEPSEDPEDAGDPSTAATAPRREVQIVFRVTPSKARLRVRGKTAPGHSILVPASKAPFLVRVEAVGYQSRNIKVVPDHNRTIVVALNRSP